MITKKETVKWVYVILFFISLLKPANSFNTIEPFDQQNGYFSIELGFDEMEPKFNNSKVKGQAILGTGLNSFMSAYLGVQVQGNKFFSNGSGGVFIGTIATLYSFNHFSFDASVEAGVINNAFYATPGIELNFDLAPDLQSMGFYINANEELTGRDTSWETDIDSTAIDESSPKHVFAPETELNIGYYVSFIPGQQLHIRFDQRFRNKPLHNERKYEIDALRFGYNMMITDGLQIQTEVNYQIPQDKDKNRFGFRIGLVKW